MKFRFKDLQDTDKEYLTHIYYDSDMSHEEKMEMLSSKYNVSARTIRRWWREELKLNIGFSSLPPQLEAASKKEIDKDTDVLFVTAAQNKTGVNKEFLKNILAYKEFLEKQGLKVQLLISPCRYRNPTAPEEFSSKRVEDWWREEVLEYLQYGKRQFADTIISSDSRVRPTAKHPLTGYEAFADNNHFLLPHPKINFKTLPRYKNEPLRTMLTTGFVTRKNYSESKAGDHGHKHHSYGFVVLEKGMIPRNVKANTDGSFTDIAYDVDNEIVNKIDSCLGFVWGDIHARVINIDFLEKTFELTNILKPQKQVLHDVFDGSTINPHEQKDMFIQRQKIANNEHLLEEEISESLALVEEIKNRVGAETYISISNHDVFLDRYVNDRDWKKDLHNSPAFLKYAYIQQTEDIREYGGIYGYLLQERFGESVKYLNYGESLKISDYQCANHGDFGANGAKGNHNTFARLNSKQISAHEHSPKIQNGVTVVGVTCNLDQYYNRRGLSSWAYAHSVIHNNGKNQLLVFNDNLELTKLL